jgi:phosphate acetyltransferase
MKCIISTPANGFIPDAKKLQRTIVLPEGSDARCLQAVERMSNGATFKSIYILNPGSLATSYLKLKEQGASLELLSESSLIQVKDSQKARTVLEITAEVIETRLRLKGRTPSEAQILMSAKLPLFQAGALVKTGAAQCALAGMNSTTSDVIRAALGTVGLAKGCSTVSGSFFMTKSDESHHNGSISSKNEAANAPLEAFMFGDCGVVVEPTIDQLVDIAHSTSMTWTKLTSTEPVVAFLSFSTKGSASHEKVDRVREAYELFKTRYPEIQSDGELQFDAAFSSEVGAKKAPGSVVPGRANVFIFPDLGAANIAYKITQRLAGFQAFGPILQGLSASYSDLSRGATVDDIVMSACIGALRSV